MLSEILSEIKDELCPRTRRNALELYPILLPDTTIGLTLSVEELEGTVRSGPDA